METENASDTYLTFHLGSEHFAVPVEQVKEIIEVLPITEIPFSPVYMRGILNLRGNVLSVVDLKQKIKQEPIEENHNTRIIVFSVNNEDKETMFGGMVDQTRDVIEINPEEIMDPPEVSNETQANIVKGVLNRDEGFILLMDINDLLSKNEINLISEAANQTA